MSLLSNSQTENADRDVSEHGHLLIRELELDDFNKGYIELLRGLTDVGDVSFDTFQKTFERQRQHRDVYRIAVIEDLEEGVIIASATLLVEDKYIHSCGRVGHIEDVVVSPLYRGKRLGFRVVNCCRQWAEDEGCYKVILDCKEELKPFYEKHGFQCKQVQMSLYFGHGQ